MIQVHIEVDERENSLYDFLSKATLPTEIHLTKKMIPLGDVVIYIEDPEKDLGCLIPVSIIERKTFQDLFASIKDGRYQEQSYRLLNCNIVPAHNIIYLIEGIITQLAEKEQTLLYSSIASLNLYKGFSIYRTAFVKETADFILSISKKILRNAKEKKDFPVCYTATTTAPTPNITDISVTPAPETPKPAPYSSVVKVEKKGNITPNNIGPILLCQIPGINTITAEQIMEKYKTIRGLIDAIVENPNCLDDFYMTTPKGSRRKLSRTIIQNIRNFLVSSSTEPI